MTQFLQNIFNWFVGFGAGVGRHFFRKYQFERVAFMAVWFKNYSKLANILKEWQYLAGMTKIQKEWQKSGKNDKNPEGMTVVRKEWQKCGRNDIKYFFEKKCFFGSYLSPSPSLLPSLGHKIAIGTLGYPIASKLENYLARHHSVDKHTHIGLYNIDIQPIDLYKLQVD